MAKKAKHETNGTAEEPIVVVEPTEADEPTEAEKAIAENIEFHEWVEKIEAAENEAHIAECEVDQLKEDLKEAKARFDARVGHLRRLVKQRSEPAQATDPQAELPLEPEPASDAWRAIEIESLSWSIRTTKALVKANLKTVGALADYSAKFGLTGIKGLGDTAKEEVTAGMEKFWADHPEYVQPADESLEVETQSEPEEADAEAVGA